jgi:hypothetical protein
MYSITENIYYSQLSSVAILLQPERNCFTPYNTRKGLGSLSLCSIVLRSLPPSHVYTCNSQQISQLFCVNCIWQCSWPKTFILHRRSLISSEQIAYVSDQNNRYCSSTTLRQTFEVHLHNQKTDVWCAITATWTKGQIFFGNTIIQSGMSFFGPFWRSKQSSFR